MKKLSDKEVISASRSIAKGPDVQRAAIEEARSRGIYDWRAHIAASPVGQAIEAGFPYRDIRPF